MNTKRRFILMTLMVLVVITAIAIAPTAEAGEVNTCQPRIKVIGGAGSPASPMTPVFVNLFKESFCSLESAIQGQEARELASWTVVVWETVSAGQSGVSLDIRIQSGLTGEIPLFVVDAMELDAPILASTRAAKRALQDILEQSRRIAPAKGRR